MSIFRVARALLFRNLKSGDPDSHYRHCRVSSDWDQVRIKLIVQHACIRATSHNEQHYQATWLERSSCGWWWDCPSQRTRWIGWPQWYIIYRWLRNFKGEIACAESIRLHDRAYSRTHYSYSDASDWNSNAIAKFHVKLAPAEVMHLYVQTVRENHSLDQCLIEHVHRHCTTPRVASVRKPTSFAYDYTQVTAAS